MKKKNRLFSLLVIALGAIVGFLVGLLSSATGLFAGITVPKGGFFTKLLLTFLLFGAAVYLQLIIHEAGHLVFGLCTGYGFLSFRIGNRMLLRRGGKLLIKKFTLAGTAGQCLLTPPDYNNGSFPCILYNLGGCILNILISLVCFIAALFAKRWGLISFLQGMALTGLITALLNGIPLNTGMLDNDGANVRSLLRSPAEKRAFWLQLKINEQQMLDVRLKDMPEDWFVLPQDADPTASLSVAIGVFAEQRALDAMMFDAASARVDALLSQGDDIAAVYRIGLILDRVYLDLVGKGKSADISALSSKDIQSYLTRMKHMPFAVRTRYAIAVIHSGDLNAARNELALFADLRNTYPSEAEIESEYALIRYAFAASAGFSSSAEHAGNVTAAIHEVISTGRIDDLPAEIVDPLDIPLDDTGDYDSLNMPLAESAECRSDETRKSDTE